MDELNRIEFNPDILSGKPVIKGTRISVEIILNKISAGTNRERIQDELDISKEDITAAVKYAEKIIANEDIYEVVS